MAELSAGQVELDGVVLGSGTPYVVAQVVREKPATRAQDQPRPRSDGVLFGRDTLDGATYVIDMTVTGDDEAAVLDNLVVVEEVWSSRDHRLTPGGTVPLRVRAPGRSVPRVVYGRPRRFSPARMDQLDAGVVPVVADFQARDHLTYDDQQQSVVLNQTSETTTGFTPPLIPPLTFAPPAERDGFATNAGEAATPVTVTFHGPSTQPSVTLLGTNEVLKLDMSLIANETVVIDTWSKTVLRGGVANVAGKLTRNSRFWQLPSGTSELRYQAVDPTATSFVEVGFRPAHYSL